MAITFLTIFHVLVTITLIFLVLIQDSKGGGLGGLSGGNSNTLLGATGATTLAAKLTRWTAIAFAASCITLAMATSKSHKSVVDSLPSSNKQALGAAAIPALSPTPTATPTPTANAPTESNTTSDQKKDESKSKK